MTCTVKCSPICSAVRLIMRMNCYSRHFKIMETWAWGLDPDSYLFLLHCEHNYNKHTQRSVRTLSHDWLLARIKGKKAIKVSFKLSRHIFIRSSLTEAFIKRAMMDKMMQTTFHCKADRDLL